MKLLIMVIVLTVSLNTVAGEDYRENEDGTYEYIGSCILHEDYEDKKFTVTEVVPYQNEPSNEFFRKIPRIFRMLATFVYNSEVGPYRDNAQFDLEGFDDITFELVNLVDSKKILHRVSYGVGGGNGGYQTFEVSGSGQTKIVARTFDGDMNFCAEEYKKK